MTFRILFFALTLLLASHRVHAAVYASFGTEISYDQFLFNEYFVNQSNISIGLAKDGWFGGLSLKSNDPTNNSYTLVTGNFHVGRRLTQNWNIYLNYNFLDFHYQFQSVSDAVFPQATPLIFSSDSGPGPGVGLALNTSVTQNLFFTSVINAVQFFAEEINIHSDHYRFSQTDVSSSFIGWESRISYHVNARFLLSLDYRFQQKFYNIAGTAYRRNNSEIFSASFTIKKHISGISLSYIW